MPVSEIFILIGPPGAGKGSLSQLCVKKFGWQQVSAGNLCRKHIAQGTAIGIQIAQALAAGQLAPERLVAQMVFEWLEAHVRGVPVILDGYPRTLLQAQLLDQFFKDKQDRFILRVIKLIASDEHLLHRMLTRYVCSQPDCQAVYSSQENMLASKDGVTCDICGGILTRRQDDNVEPIKERLSIYHQHAQELVRYYGTCGQQIDEIEVEPALSIVFDHFVQTFIKPDIFTSADGVQQ